MEEKRRHSVWLPDDVWQEVDALYKLDNCPTRNEFVEKALRYYCGRLHAERTGAYLPHAMQEVLEGSGINNEHRAGDQRAHLIGDADLVAQHVDDGGGGRYLRGHGAHHGKGDETAQDHLGGLSEPLLEQIGDGGDVEGGAYGGDTPAKPEKMNIPSR